MKIVSHRDYIIIVDYNNPSRVPDVRSMVGYARDVYGLDSVLIRGKLAPVDLELANTAFEIDLASPLFVENVVEFLRALPGSPKGVFPFSDRSILGASRLAEHLGLAGDSAKLSIGAHSKRDYRKRERQLKRLMGEQRVMVPQTAAVVKLEDLVGFSRKVGRDFILKPSCEGNNRGVLRLSPKQDLAAAFREVEQYLPQGLLCEELIDYPGEYSFDGIAHLSFVTQKTSAGGRYPVERGQTVPAPIPSSVWSAIHRAGSVANLVVGQRLGPFHNEVKIDPETGQSAIIEPNRRPAGMKIWNLAERVYGVNFYHLWLDQILAGKIPPQLPQALGVAGIRMLGTPKSGVVQGFAPTHAEREELFQALSRGLEGEWFDFELSAQEGAAVHEVPRDNSHFLGSVCLYSTLGAKELQRSLDEFERRWNHFIARFICPGHSAALSDCAVSAVSFAMG